MATRTILLPLTAHSTLAPHLLRAAAAAAATGEAGVSYRVARSRDAPAAALAALETIRSECPQALADAREFVVDFSNKRELTTAMVGCDGVLLASARGPAPPTASAARADDGFAIETALLEAARELDLRHVVKVSCAHGLMGAGAPHVAFARRHWELEQQAREVASASRDRNDGSNDGMQLTLVHPTTMMDAFLRGRLWEMVCGRTLSVSVKHGRIAFVHPMDVADVVHAKLLQGGAGTNAADASTGVEECDLTGPEAISFEETAQQLSAVLPGASVRYSYFPLWAVQPSMWIRGESPDVVSDEIELARAREDGAEAAVTEAVAHVLHRSPRTFREFALEHKESWPLQSYK